MMTGCRLRRQPPYGAQQEEWPLAPVFGRAHCGTLKLEGIAQHPAHQPHRNRRRRGLNQQPGSEVAGQLFEDEDRAADGSVEGDRESRAGAGRVDHAAVFLSGSRNRENKVPNEAPICTVGPSRPSAKPGPMASNPPKNFTGTTAERCGFDFAGEDGFNTLHAAAFGIWRELDNQQRPAMLPRRP